MILLKSLLLSLFVFSLALTPAQSATAPPESQDTTPTARIAGEGIVLAYPDIALMNFTITTEAPRAPQASAENARKAEAFLNAVKKLLHEGESVKTTGYRIFPLTTPGEKGKKPAITGYRASSSFQVKLKDPARLGEVIDLGVQQGVNEMHGPIWQHSQIEALTQEASVQALQKAKQMAEVLAASQGLKIKRLQKVITGARMAPIPRAETRFKEAFAAADFAATPIEVGEQEIRAQVEAVFELE